MPFADAEFDVVTCIYLFHELPPRIRRAAVAEIRRVLRPGGTLIFVDSLQTGDEPDYDGTLELFPVAFHEPYYESYLREDLDRLSEILLRRETIEREEFLGLIEATRVGKTFRLLTGPDRVVLYCLAGNTGLRASEMAGRVVAVPGTVPAASRTHGTRACGATGHGQPCPWWGAMRQVYVCVHRSRGAATTAAWCRRVVARNGLSLLLRQT